MVRSYLEDLVADSVCDEQLECLGPVGGGELAGARAPLDEDVVGVEAVDRGAPAVVDLEAGLPCGEPAVAPEREVLEGGRVEGEVVRPLGEARARLIDGSRSAGTLSS